MGRNQPGPLERDFARYRDQGDLEAMARVFDAAAPKLLLVAAHLGESAADCEDLVQATFLGALTARDEWDPGKPLMPWLTSILGHRAIDARRKRDVRRAESLGEAPVELDPAQLSADEEHATLVADAIARVPDAQRDVLLLRVVHGLEPVEIAHALGRSPGTVRSQLARGRERLMQHLPSELRAMSALSLAAVPNLTSVRRTVLAESARTAPVVVAGAAATAPILAAVMNAKVVAASLCALGIGIAAWSVFAAPTTDRDSRVTPGSSSETESVAALEIEGLDEAFARRPALTSGSAPTEVVPEAEATESAPALGGLSVVGRVIDLEERPVAGARVLRIDRAHEDGATLVATTDEAGEFEAASVPFGASLMARAKGYQPSDDESRARVDGARVELQLGALGIPLSGRVVHPNGDDVPHPTIAVAVDEDAREELEGVDPRPRSADGDKPWDTEVFVIRGDAEGRFNTDEVPRASVSLFARSTTSPGLVAAVTLDQSPERRRVVELMLGPGGEVRGRVTTSAGRGMPGLRVASEFKGSAELGGLEAGYGIATIDRETVTDGDGSYRLVGLFPGRHRVIVGPEDRGMADASYDVLAGQVIDWSPVIETSDHLRVRVVDERDAPVPGQAVWVTPSYDPNDISGLDRFTTDGEGRCTIVGLREGEHFVAVFPPSPTGFFRRVPVHLSRVTPSGDEVTLRVASDELGAIHGRLSLAPETERTPRVRLVPAGLDDGEAVRVERDGAFRFDDVPAGSYALRFEGGSAGYTEDVVAASVSLARSQDLDVGTLAPDPGTTLVLELLPTADDRLDDVEVHVQAVSGDDRWGSRARRVDGTLRFVAGGLAPGRYHVSVRGEGATTQSWEVPVGADRAIRDPRTGTLVQAESLQLRNGVDVTFEVRFVPAPEGPGIRERAEPGCGRVDFDLFDANGRRIESDRMDVPFSKGRANTIHIVRRLAPGTHHVRVEDERCDGWEKPRVTRSFDVPASGPVVIDLR